MTAKKLAQKTPGRPAKSEQINVRFPRPLIERIDRYAREQSKFSGFIINRSQALRRLCEIGLDALEPQAEPKALTWQPEPIDDDLFIEAKPSRPKRKPAVVPKPTTGKY
jgi:hypothetical protein